MSLRLTLALLAPAALLVACGQPPPATPVVAAPSPPAAVPEVAGATEVVDFPQPLDVANYVDRDGTIHIIEGPTLRRYCIGQDPFFHFESDKLTPADEPGLYALAVCMKTGPLQGKRIRLTGRADPRGTAELNMKLGLERADRVKAFLVDQGVAADRIETATAGKVGAAPAPDRWRTDRRVDIDMVP